MTCSSKLQQLAHFEPPSESREPSRERASGVLAEVTGPVKPSEHARVPPAIAVLLQW
jgi:hypothetical protein